MHQRVERRRDRRIEPGRAAPAAPREWPRAPPRSMAPRTAGARRPSRTARRRARRYPPPARPAPARLLRRHVGRRAQHRARPVFRLIVVDRSRRLVVDDARQPEVEHLHVAVGPDHDVLRLDVAMDDAGGVRGGERARHLAADVDRRCRAVCGALDDRAQRPPVDELLHDEELAGRRLADFVDGDDVGVVERRGGARLAQEALDDRRLLGAGVAHHLDRDRPVQPRVEGAEHLAHAAAADAHIDAVVPEGSRCHRGSGCAAPASTIHPDRPGALWLFAGEAGQPFRCQDLEQEIRSSESKPGGLNRSSGDWEMNALKAGPQARSCL